MDKKKIVIFIDWFTPGFKGGGSVRSYSNLVQHLSPYFDFYFITRDTDYCETEPYSSVSSNQWNVLNDGLQVFYISKDKLSYSYLKNTLNSIDYDVAYVNGIFSKFFSIYPLLILKKNKKPVIVATRGMLASSAVGIKSFKKKPFLFLASLLGLYHNVTFHATNNKEKEDVLTVIGKHSKIKVAPNLPKLKSNQTIEYIIKNPGELKLISLARISPEKNFEQLFKLLKQQSGKIYLEMYGTRDNDSYWKACESLIKTMPENIKIKYCGVINPIFIEETLKKFHFMISLTLGENFGHVILESFMADRPVIISDQTPWKELKKKNVGWDLDLNNNKIITEIIDYTVNMKQDEFNKMIESANNYANSIVKDKKAISQSISLFKH